jgi:hypothetical protein
MWWKGRGRGKGRRFLICEPFCLLFIAQKKRNKKQETKKQETKVARQRLCVLFLICNGSFLGGILGGILGLRVKVNPTDRTHSSSSGSGTALINLMNRLTSSLMCVWRVWMVSRASFLDDLEA